MSALLQLVLACASQPDWVFDACEDPEWVYQGNVWRTQPLEDQVFVLGAQMLTRVDGGRPTQLTPPLESVEQVFLYQDRLWASDWREGLAVCEQEGWRLVETPPLGGESGDRLKPFVLERGLVMVGSFNPDPDCTVGDCSAGYQVSVWEDGVWESIAGGGALEMRVVRGVLWARMDGAWQVLEEEGFWSPLDPALPKQLWVDPTGEWLVGRDEDGLWWAGPPDDLTQIPAPETHEATRDWRAVTVVGPGDYLLSDLEGTWRYQDGAWTALPLAEGSWPKSASAAADGVLVTDPPQWVDVSGARALDL